MRRMRLVTAVVMAATFLILEDSVVAQQTPTKPVDSRLLTGVFAPDPEGVWRKTDQIHSTSQCIGDPITPLCAIETWDTCFVRKNIELCRIAMEKFLSDPFRFHSGPKENHYSKYRVVSVRRATADDIRSGPRRLDSRQIGDLLIEIEWQPCWKGERVDDCTTFSAPTTYTMRQFDGRWAVVNVHQPRH